jgi:NAD(P)H dehydrogenase (quinone)
MKSIGKNSIHLMPSFLAQRLTWLISARSSKNSWKDSSPHWMAQKWTDKLAAGFTVSGSPPGDKLSTLQSLMTFALQHGMCWVCYNRLPETYAGVTREEARNFLGSFSGLMLQTSNTSPEIALTSGDLASAEDFGERIAKFLLK